MPKLTSRPEIAQLGQIEPFANAFNRPRTWAFGATILIVCLLHSLTLQSLRFGFGGTETAFQTTPFSTRIIAPAVTKPTPPTDTKIAQSPPKTKPPAQQATASTQIAPDENNALTSPQDETTTSDTLNALDKLKPEPVVTQEPTQPVDNQPVDNQTVTLGEKPLPVTVTEQSQQPFSVNYRAKISGFPEGVAQFELKVKDGRYELKLEAKDFGYFRSSTGLLSDKGFIPEVFREKRPFKSELAAHILRDRQQIIFSNNSPTAPIIDATIQDELSIMIQLASLLSSAPQLQTPGTPIQFQTVRKDSAEDWIFHVIGSEIISLPNGQALTLKLERQPRKEFDTKVEIWFAPILGYQPVRIQLTSSDGKFVLLQSLSKVTYNIAP